jgi:tight adherence protein C
MEALTICSPAFISLDPWDIGISIGAFLATFLLIVATFGQQGEIKLSPQRAAAIATGHADRVTVFENPALRPFMMLMLTLAHRLSLPRLKAWVRIKLIAAGSPNYYTSEEYLALSMMVGAVTGLVVLILYLIVYGQVSILFTALGVLVGFGLMLYQLHDQASKRLRQIGKRLPYSLDLVSLAMGAGATFTEAVRTIVREESEDPFNVELKTLLAEMDLGTTRRQSLQNLADRVPLDSVQSIVASVMQAEELGTPLGDVLHDQATLLRLHRSYRAENAAAVASVRILLPCLLLVLAVILAVFAPAIVRAVRKGLF